MLKIWNVFLICLTFFLTIFGTFLTRAGIIASVHSFAQSDIGKYFVGFMALIAAVSAGLIVWRLPQLRAKTELEAVASREAMFVVNNWALLGAMTFILVATMFPKISELWGESVTVGPPFFNRWLAPIGIVIFALMGLAPLFGWRKTSPDALKKAFRAPLIATVAMFGLHVAFGKSLGYPAFVEKDPFYPGVLGVVIQKIGSAVPCLIIALAAFNVAVIVQEFWRGVAARRAGAKKREETESVLYALYKLVDKNRRRYGGYIVHLGIVCMFVGFAGGAWTLEHETNPMLPGQTHRIGAYELTYRGTRMCPGSPKCSREEQADLNKRALFADFDVSRGGKYLGRVTPAKFFYHKQPESPTTEVGLRRSLTDDLYVIIGSVDPQSKKGVFRIHVNPLVSWIWVGLLVLILGAGISLWPELSYGEVGVWAYVRSGAGVAAGAGFAIWLAMSPSLAYAEVRPDPPVATTSHASLPSGLRTGAVLAPAAGVALGLLASRRVRRSDTGPR